MTASRLKPVAAGQQLQAMVHGLTQARGVRHAIVAVGSADGEPIWIGTAGTADGASTPMRAGTPFFLASVTKLYIAAAILRLHEEGRIRLDAPMADYLSTRLVNGLHRWKGEERTADITVRHLLGHASGLPEYLVLARRGEKSLFDRAGGDSDFEWGIEEIADLVRSRGRPAYPPRPFDGRRHSIRYSDTNFQLLIAIIETVYGRALQDAFEDLLFRPLGLNRTFLPGTRAISPAPAAFWAGDDRLDTKPGMLRSFRDLYSTAEDTLRFMAALVQGRLFERPPTAKLMCGHFNRFALSFSLRPVGPGWPVEYGLGMMRFRMPRLFTGFRQAPTLFGHTGVTGSWLFHVPALDLIVSGTVDQVAGAPIPFRFVARLVLALESLGRIRN